MFMIDSDVTNVLYESYHNVNHVQRNDDDNLPFVFCGVDKFSCKFFRLTAEQLQLILTRANITNGIDIVDVKSNTFRFFHGNHSIDIQINNDAYHPNVRFIFYSHALRYIKLTDYILTIGNFFDLIDFKFGVDDTTKYLKQNLIVDECEVFVDLLCNKTMHKKFKNFFNKIGTLKESESTLPQAKINVANKHRNAISAAALNKKENLFFRYPIYHDGYKEQQKTNKSKHNSTCRTFYKVYNKLWDLCLDGGNHWFDFYCDFLGLDHEMLNIIKNTHSTMTQTQKINMYRQFKSQNKMIIRIEYGSQYHRLQQWVSRPGSQRYRKFLYIDKLLNNVNTFMTFLMTKVMSIDVIDDNTGCMGPWHINDIILEVLRKNATIEPPLVEHDEEAEEVERIKTIEDIKRATPGNMSRIINNIKRFEENASSHDEFESYCNDLKSRLHRITDMIESYLRDGRD
jgi:hypothetical protein